MMRKLRIDPRFDVLPGDVSVHHVGAYVRRVGIDMGTGIVLGVSKGQVMDEETNHVHWQLIYTVRWLDQKLADGATPIQHHAESELAASARGVPKFSGPADAEAWMERQVEGGNWVAKAQDATDTAGDMDVLLTQLLDEEDRKD